MNRHIVLVGLMGSGKSTIARLLHRKLEAPTYEVDSLIEKTAGKTIPEIFSQDGEVSFRRIESETVAALMGQRPGIISTGGGTFVKPENQQLLLENGVVFYLHGTPPELAKRIQSTVSRPLLHGRDKVEVLQELFQARHPAYQQAHYTVKTDHRTSQDVAEEIWTKYDQAASAGS
jgi:shikimate kinase